MTDDLEKRLAEFLSSAVHNDLDGVEVYGSSFSENGTVYIEGDIDGEEFAATLEIVNFGMVDDDSDLEEDEDD